MNGKVHYWIVCDAVSYIKHYGNPLQKQALQVLELAYGERKSIQDIPIFQTAVERLAGFESWHTDKFGDLSLQIPGLFWRTKRNLTGLFGHTFTAFNHFINPHPDGENIWSKACGYSYNSSSMKGFDSFVIKGISVYLRGLIDKENSLVLERIRPSWKKGDSEWKHNFKGGLVNTSFVPWNVLVKFYYTHLLHEQHIPLEVRGPNSHLVGLQLLGPVFHAIADASSPQHVRPALGFGHQAWENYVQTRVYNRQINVNPVLIHKILQEPEFNREWISPSGRLQGHFDIESFVYQLSVNTAATVSRSTSSTWRDIYKAGENFWKWYLTGEKIEDDTTYLYHQAVAGTIYVITMAYKDLLNLGIINRDGLESRNKLPAIRCVQDEGVELLSVSVGEKAIPAEETRPDPLRKASDVLGCETSGNSEVQKLIDEFENLYTKSSVSNRKGRLFSELLEKLEESAVQEYRIQAENLGDKFCPLRRMEHIPIDSDVSAHFGIETYRLPSLTECEDHSMFAHYMEKLDEHSEVAHKLELTMCAASLTHIKSKCQFSESRCRRLESLIDTLHEERDDTE